MDQRDPEKGFIVTGVFGKSSSRKGSLACALNEGKTLGCGGEKGKIPRRRNGKSREGERAEIHGGTSRRGSASPRLVGGQRLQASPCFCASCERSAGGPFVPECLFKGVCVRRQMEIESPSGAESRLACPPVL